VVPFGGLRADRERRAKVAAYVQNLMIEPGATDVDWLATIGTGGDADHAMWELRYARRALGLIAAQRDALDDATGSLVARELMSALSRDPHVGAGKREIAEAQFNARLGAYREAIDTPGAAPMAARMGLTLIAFSGGSFREGEATVGRAGALLERYLLEANEALRAQFGAASLPDNIAPSAIHPHG